VQGIYIYIPEANYVPRVMDWDLGGEFTLNPFTSLERSSLCLTFKNRASYI